MPSLAWSAVTHGADAVAIEVSFEELRRLPAIVITGLPPSSVPEVSARVRESLIAADPGERWPRGRCVFQLTPADIAGRSSHSTGTDLAMAVLAARPDRDLSPYLFAAELSLAGQLRGQLREVRGLVGIAELAKAMGKILVCASSAAGRLRKIVGGRIVGLPLLVDVLDLVVGPVDDSTGKDSIVIEAPERRVWADLQGTTFDHSLDEIRDAIRAHQPILLRGAPGCGMTATACRMTSLLPPLTADELRDVARVYSAAGLPSGEDNEVARPFRAPHHSISVSGMIGSASLLPGETALAHHGILFLDEVQEFSKPILDATVRAWRDRYALLQRPRGVVTFPTDFALVMSAPDEATIARYNLTPEAQQRAEERVRRATPPDALVVHVTRPQIPRLASVEVL